MLSLKSSIDQPDAATHKQSGCITMGAEVRALTASINHLLVN
jgi:hypothetical protein